MLRPRPHLNTPHDSYKNKRVQIIKLPQKNYESALLATDSLYGR